MSLIKSISGIRGTIGGDANDGLNPINTIQFVNAYAQLIKQTYHCERPKIVVGRDARISGDMISHAVTSALLSSGCDVVNIGLATTPTTEMAVIGLKADGGIIITASHNPKQWNALKLLNHEGEFLNAEQGALITQTNEEDLSFVTVDQIGHIESMDYTDAHIDAILQMPEVDAEAIRTANLKVAFDAINSVGGIALPRLLKRLGVEQIIPIHAEPTGNFTHNPEPLPKHLSDLCTAVQQEKADVGFSVDPDVDRLAIIDENGQPFGEEYTLVAVADYLLSLHGAAHTVSNMSSTRALKDVAERYGGTYSSATVGEVNVVTEMRATNALIGGEGNGGVIYPRLHTGRDALLGVALFLSHLVKKGVSVSTLRASYPNYEMCKERLELTDSDNPKALIANLAQRYATHNPDLRDGLKIEFEQSWVQVRASNTEPIIRIYTEAPTADEAKNLAEQFKSELQQSI